MSTHLPVGVFDSGVGGLTVVKAIQQRLPDLDILYVADSAYAPYGGKSVEQVRERASHITRFLIEQGAQAIVVACNTATAMAVEHLRTQFDIPIIAMEPAIKPAAAATRSGVIGVLATAGTLESERYGRLLACHGSQVRVLGRVCHHWVELVESVEIDTEMARSQVTHEVLPLLDAGADTLVLGCTHFPFLAPIIREVAGPKVSLIDPAPAVAGHLANRLGTDWQGRGQTSLWSSRQAEDEAVRLSRLLGMSARVSRLP
jgi:glutamate racemase